MILETYHRIFTSPSSLRATTLFYQCLLSHQPTLRFTDPATNLEIVGISTPHSSILIIAGSDEDLAPFKETKLTIRVEKLEVYFDLLKALDAKLLDDVQKTPVGRKMRWKHADGLVVEYVEHDSE